MKENKKTQKEDTMDRNIKKKSVGFFTLIVWMVIVFLVFILCVLLFCLNPYVKAWGPWFIVVAGAALLGTDILLGFVAAHHFNRQMRNNTIQAAIDMDFGFRQALNKWTNPTVVFNADGRVIWRNEAFISQEINGEMLGQRMEDLGIGLEGLRYEVGDKPYESDVTFNERDYHCVLRAVTIKEPIVDKFQKIESKIFLLSLKDVTQINALKKENADLQPIVVNVRLDNYENIMENLEETEKPMVISKVYQAIAKMAEETNGVLLQPTDDRFVLIFHHKDYTPIENGKLKILNELNESVKAATEHLSISMGIGVAHDVDEAFSYSKDAMKLAMRRGGDQGVIKDKDGFDFIGAKNKNIENVDQVRARLMKTKFEEVINNSKRILIMGHRAPDMDALGSALGLYRMVRELNEIPAHIVLGENTEAVRFLLDRLLAQPDAEIMYIDEAKALKYIEEDGCNLFVTDVNVPTMVESEALLNRAIEKGAAICVVDHHTSGEVQIPNTTVSFVDAAASSASEMVTMMLKYIAPKMVLTKEEANALLAGIFLDTKSFTVGVKDQTFETAALLEGATADVSEVKQFFKQTFEDFQLKLQLTNSFELIEDGVACIYWETDVPNWNILAASLADELLEVSGINMSFAITKTTDGVKLSARCNENYTVQRIVEEIPQNEETHCLNAGGTPRAAAAQFTTEATKESVIELIIQSIQKIKEETT